MSREDDARRLLEDKLFVEAFNTLGEELQSRWAATSVEDVAQRESIWLALRLLDRIQAHITSIVETGHMARIMEKQHPHI
jgi:hypothetical protein|tara:strand:+ start:2886 stop:3125 length:240 start_codon:yes stop_codon:yes gene_type:complete